MAKQFWDRHPPQYHESYEVMEGVRYVVQRIYGLPDEPDPRLALIVGDAIDNARSALNHLVCALVAANRGKPSRQHEFPIWEQAPANTDRRRKFKAKLKGMHPDDSEAIRLLQPFMHPGADASTKLVQLDDPDNAGQAPAVDSAVHRRG